MNANQLLCEWKEMLQELKDKKTMVVANTNPQTAEIMKMKVRKESLENPIFEQDRSNELEKNL